MPVGHGVPNALPAMACALVFLGLVLFVLPGATVSASFTHDLFVYLGGIHRVEQGQLTSRDFYSPLGLLGYYLPYLGHRLVGQFGGAMEAASFLALLGAMPVAVIALRNRVPPLAGGLLLVAVPNCSNSWRFSPTHLSETLLSSGALYR